MIGNAGNMMRMTVMLVIMMMISMIRLRMMIKMRSVEYEIIPL